MEVPRYFGKLLRICQPPLDIVPSILAHLPDLSTVLYLQSV